MLTIDRVLFPTDFSEGARQPFPQAAFLADWHDAELHILNVTGRHRHDFDEDRERFPVSAGTLTEWLRGPDAAETTAAGPDLKALSVMQEQVESSVPAEVIVDYAGDENVDLAVMGTHGRRGVDRMLFGSVTEEVVRQAPCLVFTVQTGAEVAPGEAVRRVLAPVDFSEASEAAVHHVKEIALTYGAEINLLHAVEEPLYPAAYGVEPVKFPTLDVIDQVEQQLGDLVRVEIGHEHARIEAQVGHPPTTILEYIDEHDVDLIVIATHGRTGLERVLLGSVTERVLRRSPVPVFIVKPDRKSLLPPDRA